MSDVQVIIDLIGEIDVEDVEKDSSLFMYQGFNPEMVIKHLLDRKVKKNISNDVFKDDMKALVIAGTMMGNVTDRNLLKIKLEGKNKINELYNRYELRKGGIANARTAVNIPRLMSTFPILACRCLMNKSITPKEFGGEMETSELDKFFKTPVFPSLIPKSLPMPIIHVFLVVSTCYTTEQSLAIGKDKTIDVVFRKQFGFAKIAYGSNIPREEERKSHFDTLTFHLDPMRRCFKKACKMMKSEAEFPALDSWKEAQIKVM